MLRTIPLSAVLLEGISTECLRRTTKKKRSCGKTFINNAVIISYLLTILLINSVFLKILTTVEISV